MKWNGKDANSCVILLCIYCNIIVLLYKVKSLHKYFIRGPKLSVYFHVLLKFFKLFIMHTNIIEKNFKFSYSSLTNNCCEKIGWGFNAS